MPRRHHWRDWIATRYVSFPAFPRKSCRPAINTCRAGSSPPFWAGSIRNSAASSVQGFAGKVAVVTGAGSGIGQSVAVELARSGASVAISDIDTDGLEQTEQRLKEIGASVKADRLDVAERDAFIAYAEQVNDYFGKVNQIYNNAGVTF